MVHGVRRVDGALSEIAGGSRGNGGSTQEKDALSNACR